MLRSFAAQPRVITPLGLSFRIFLQNISLFCKRTQPNLFDTFSVASEMNAQRNKTEPLSQCIQRSRPVLNDTLKSPRSCIEHNCVPVHPVLARIKVRPGKLSSPEILRLQFPLTLAWTYTVHKVQGLTLNEIVGSFNNNNNNNNK